MTRIVTHVRHGAGGRIEGLSGPDPSGEWHMNRAAVSTAIDSGELFLVEEPLGHYVEVRVIHNSGREYVSTVADGTKVDNLKTLTEDPQ